METNPVPGKLVLAAPPYGHIICHEKWRGSALELGLKGSVKMIFEEELGGVDFCLSNKTCILYVSETDLVAGNGYRRKIVRFRNAHSDLQGVVIVEKTRVSEQHFGGLQKLVVLELGLTLLPVSTPAEASQLIAQLAKSSPVSSLLRLQSCLNLMDTHQPSRNPSRPSTAVLGENKENPFRRKSVSSLLEPVVLSLVQQIPGVGKVKATLLLQRFPSIHQLSKASVHELEPIVGQATAQHVTAFFNNPFT